MPGLPAARVTDMHTCAICMGAPMPIMPPGAPTVLIGGLPAARMSDLCTCANPVSYTHLDVYKRQEYEHAKARGAKIYAEVLGYGLTGDAHHITAPSEDGEGGFRSMQMALKRAGLQPADVDYINAHGTSTMADTIELGAVERLMGDAAAGATMSSTKSSIGHLLGACLLYTSRCV